MAIPPARLRTILRTAHLVGSVVLAVYIYSPRTDEQVFTNAIRFVTVPQLTITGLFMWQLPRLRRIIRERRMVRTGVVTP